MTRKVFARAFKREVRVADDLAPQTERLLERSALDALAIAGKPAMFSPAFPKSKRRSHKAARPTSWR